MPDAEAGRLGRRRYFPAMRRGHAFAPLLILLAAAPATAADVSLYQFSLTPADRGPAAIRTRVHPHRLRRARLQPEGLRGRWRTGAHGPLG